MKTILVILVIAAVLLIFSKKTLSFSGSYADISYRKQPKDSVLKSSDGSGIMAVDEILSMEGRGIVVTGTVSHGSFKINDKVFIYSQTGKMLNLKNKGYRDR